MERYKRVYTEDVWTNDTFKILGNKYHVGKADKFIKLSPHRLIDINLDNLSKWFSVIKINKEYALNRNENELNDPGIWISDNNRNFKFLIDGWHRAYRLFHDGKKYMKVYVIDDSKEIEEITIK